MCAHSLRQPSWADGSYCSSHLAHRGGKRLPWDAQSCLARRGPAEIIPVQTPQDTLNHCPLLLLTCSHQKGAGSWMLPCWRSPVTAAFLNPKIKPLLFILSTQRSLRSGPGGISTLSTQVTQIFVKYWHGLAEDLKQSQDLVILSWVDNLLSE